MGDSLGSKLNFLQPVYHALASFTCYTGLVFYDVQRELQLMQRERALLELERRWRGGQQWPPASKSARLSGVFDYILRV